MAPELAFEALLVRSGAARGGSWGLLGSLLAPLGVVLGLPRCPRRLPEGPREGPGESPGGHFGSFFAAGPAGTQKARKNLMFHDFLKLFWHAFSAFFFAVAAAPTLERTLENIGFHSEGIANFACRADD